MNKQLIRDKFGNDYYADEMTYKLGIDIRFTDHLALRFKGLTVLETCSGGGFSTIALAGYAKHVYSFDIDKARINDARKNAKIAGVAANITFIHDDIFNITKTKIMPEIETAFADPDWADTESNHEYKYIDSNTKPPSDLLLKFLLKITSNVTLIQPPYIRINEFSRLPDYEFECLYMNNTPALYCLHFGELAQRKGKSEYRV